MLRFRLVFAVAGLATLVTLLGTFPSAAQNPKQAKGKAKKAAPLSWIWSAKAESKQTIYLRKEFTAPAKLSGAHLYGSGDNSVTVFLNGKEILKHDNWETPFFKDVTKELDAGGKEKPHVLAVVAHNTDGAAGVLMRLELMAGKTNAPSIHTDGTWKVSDKAVKGWNTVGFDDSKWASASVQTVLGGGPWFAVTEARLSAAAKVRKITATPIELIKPKKDFKVELLYSVPRDTQGSWVSMTFDPKGRILASDQSGKLYRITPPALGGAADTTVVEEVPADIGEAHGLLWAFDSLYVVVNRGRKYDSGLYRVTSSKNNDTLDKVQLLRKIDGGGEHGPHAVVLSPDGKSLHLCAGNHTKLVDLASSTVPKIWGEDFLVPRLWDASGHAVGILAPAGCIYQTDPDGKEFKLISMGYRNQYDFAFNRAGDIFTYDSDMEWDMSLPWYRPTRVCHAVPGSEFGWRGGTGKMYEYHPDNLPPTVNVGPGSPTGVAFGYGAKFPAKYQEALFLCDWSYGKLYACHITPQGASYKGELEEFMTGSPLPLTDLAVSPKDGALYFTIGGRNTMSGLYRVTYVGKESTEPSNAKPDLPELHQVRRKLESYYGKKDASAVEAAWPYLSHEDRFLRYAARTVLEFQEPSTWQDRLFAEKNPIAITHGVIGLARTADKTLESKLLATLEKVDWTKLTNPQKIDHLRAYQLVFRRMGEAEPEWKVRASKRLDSFYPATSTEVNAELSKLISHLEVPGGVTKTMALLAKAPTQEEQIEYALGLRSVKSGWSLEQRKDYLQWFHKGMTYRGGNSFHKFLQNIRTDALKTFGDNEKSALKAEIANLPVPKSPKFDLKPRPFVKKWTLEELAPVVDKGLSNRNFDNGRHLFGAAKCFLCHRYANEGGGTGPDLTSAAGRFDGNYLLNKILFPSKTISDQYQAINVTTSDGRVFSGRIVNLAGEGIMINTDMLDPNQIAVVNRNQIESMGPSPISLMPEGLLDTLQQDEVLDLFAYLLSRGDRNHPMFRKK